MNNRCIFLLGIFVFMAGIIDAREIHIKKRLLTEKNYEPLDSRDVAILIDEDVDEEKISSFLKYYSSTLISDFRLKELAILETRIEYPGMSDNMLISDKLKYEAANLGSNLLIWLNHSIYEDTGGISMISAQAYRIEDIDGDIVEDVLYFTFPIISYYENFYKKAREMFKRGYHIGRTYKINKILNSTALYKIYWEESRKIRDDVFSDIYLYQENSHCGRIIEWRYKNTNKKVDEQEIKRLYEKERVRHNKMVELLIRKYAKEYAEYKRLYKKYYGEEPKLAKEYPIEQYNLGYFKNPEQVSMILTERFDEIIGDKIFSVEEFANLIRKEFPEYSYIKNRVLVGRFVQKYPEYKRYINFWK